MGYIDSFTQPDYNRDPGILGIYQFIQSGYDAGKARAQNQQLAQLSQAAYNDTGDQQKDDISQAIGVNPQAGFQLAGMAQQQQAAQQQQQQAMMQKFGKAASAILQAKQAGDNTTAEGIYQAIVPDLRTLSAQNGGPEPPSTLDGTDMSSLYKLAAMYGQIPGQAKPISVAPGTTLIDPTTHKPVYTAPAAPQKPQVDLSSGLQYDPVTGTAKQIPLAGSGGLGGLPTETQAYVPKVLAALGNQPAFDAQGNPTPAFVAAITQVESHGNPKAVSPAGAQGLMQLMPATAASVGVTNSFDPVQNIKGGTAYLRQLGQQFGNDPAKVAAAYNAGPGAVSKAMQASTVGEYQAQRAAEMAADKQKNSYNSNQPQELGDPTLSGPQYLASIPAQDRGTVLSVLQGRMAPPSGSAAKSSYWMGVLNAANKIDPTFDAVDYQSRYKTAQSYAPSGTQGSQIIALNTMIQHINQLQKTYDQIGNGNSPAINSIRNKFEYETGLGSGRDALKAYELNANAAAQEIESLWKKGGGNESDIALYRDKLSSSNDPATQRQVIGKMLDLALGRLQSLHSSYVNAMGSGATPKQFVTPQSLQIVQSLAPEALAPYQQNAQAPASGQIANPQGQGGWSIQKVGQ